MCSSYGNGRDKTPVARFSGFQDYKNKGEKTSQDPIDYLNSIKNLITKTVQRINAILLEG